MLSLGELMLQFEALGDNCEFGLVQRAGGAEPLGLLRFAGFFIPVEKRLNRLCEALEVRFDGLGKLDTVHVEAAGPEDSREYLIKESAYGLMYHSFQSEGRIDPETLRRQESRKLEFLRRKLLADLEAGEKILIWKSNIPLEEAEVMRLVEVLARFGPNRLLWVEAADAAHPAGSVEIRGERLLRGYVDRLAPYDEATDVSYQSWFKLCAEAGRVAQAMCGAEPAFGSA